MEFNCISFERVRSQSRSRERKKTGSERGREKKRGRSSSSSSSSGSSSSSSRSRSRSSSSGSSSGSSSSGSSSGSSSSRSGSSHSSGSSGSRKRTKTKRKTSESPKRRKRSPTPKPTKLHIGKLTRNVNRDHMMEIFSVYGQIKNLDMPIDRFHPEFTKGFAYIEYDKPEEAEKAVKYMDGGQIDGQEITAQPVLIQRPIGHHHDEDLRHKEEDRGLGQGHQHVGGDTVDQVLVHPDDFNISEI
ncbi:hypothetical protein KUTeg_003153 [Tegillarca granosa]|uniref:RRM domain-containing protein n=1 Tax=Tegillarca granosa TaxID=220873 RepID=A0ABQ9FN55_TEGGR|nr:hypothetical protein KUTeg_003153 [Tegillarca granosa]